ncbi:hypothetical protein ACHWQZ_G004793 [Mnemiopsis leidyi]
MFAGQLGYSVILFILVTVCCSEETFPDSCRIEEQGGFLQNVCKTEITPSTKIITNRCVHSDESYTIQLPAGVFEGLCSNDPHFYQACYYPDKSGDIKINNGYILCEYYLCDSKKYPGFVFSSNVLESLREVCNNETDCINTDLDESGCTTKETTVMPSGKSVPSFDICDEKCDTFSCEDEANCNGFTYGIYCEKDGKKNNYVAPWNMCTDTLEYMHCDNGEDKASCSRTNNSESSCSHQGKMRQFFNFTCVPPLTGDSTYWPLCDDHKDQLNCSDPSKAGLTCFVNGSLSTVSKYMICYNSERDIDKSLCDDGIENKCLAASKKCGTIHQHLLCDKTSDCEDGSDEERSICRSLTVRTCKRRVGNAGELPIPLDWLVDGVEDCTNGIDEEAWLWPKCGVDRTRRFVTSNGTCENVFLCPGNDPTLKYEELGNICTGMDVCGHDVCSVSRNFLDIRKTVLSSDKGLTKRIAFCLKGLVSLEFLHGECDKEHFIFPNDTFFGINNTTQVILPNETTNCDSMFGEQYVFTSCLNKCENSLCPLRNVPRYEVCMDQYPKRIGTLANNEYLAFFTRSHGDILNNRYFVCDNKVKCIEYSQVCDLIDDCGDASDEINCTNNFQCNKTDSIDPLFGGVNFIPKYKKCDEKIDCIDFSDECNESCSLRILKKPLFRGFTWFMGLAAILANFIIMVKSLYTLRNSRNTIVLINKSLVIIISLGDFFVGCYLITIAVYDGIVYKNGYCTKQMIWLTSWECSVVGALNTFGSQISLFSMTLLSTIRLYIIWKSTKIPGKVTWMTWLQVLLGVILLVTASLLIAIIPILHRFEDFFVNGEYFAPKLKLFIGSADKKDIIKVLKSYYGRMKDITLSWSMINTMVGGMFSHDLSYKDHITETRKVHFYGNDGVCLFKYFVDQDDPQRVFVWSILGLNFFSFISISVSYLLIILLTRKSTKNVANTKTNKNASKRNSRMNRRIAIIITTDFLCWIPFLVICCLHSLEIIHASNWYATSMILLPINSVINPLIYDNTVTKLITGPVNKVTSLVSNSAAVRSVLSRAEVVQVETVEMDRIVEEGAGAKNLRRV